MRSFREGIHPWQPYWDKSFPVKIVGVNGRAIHVDTVSWAAPGDVLWQAQNRSTLIDAVDKETGTLVVREDVPWSGDLAYVIRDAYRVLPDSVVYPNKTVVAPAPIIVAPAPGPASPVVAASLTTSASPPAVVAAGAAQTAPGGTTSLPWGWLAVAGAVGLFFLTRRRGA